MAALTLAQLQVINNLDPSGQIAAAIAAAATATITVSGTANQVTATTVGTTVTVTLPATMVTPGSFEVTGFLQEDGLLKRPYTPTAVANGATINLSTTKSLNVLRPTSDATIAGAVINMPTSPTDGQVCIITSSAAITTVTGTLATAPVPPLTTMQAAQRRAYAWNASASLWLTA